MRVLLVDSVSDSRPFPNFQACVVDLTFDLDIFKDPLGNILITGQLTDAHRDAIDKAYDKALQNPTFVVNEFFPEWVEGGRAQVIAANIELKAAHDLKLLSNPELGPYIAEDVDDIDDDTLALCYLTQNLMTLAGCAAIYNPTWY